MFAPYGGIGGKKSHEPVDLRVLLFLCFNFLTPYRAAPWGLDSVFGTESILDERSVCAADHSDTDLHLLSESSKQKKYKVGRTYARQDSFTSYYQSDILALSFQVEF